MLRRKSVRWVLLIGAVVLALAFIGGAGGVGWLWLRHDKTVVLPAPAGPYAVGRTEFEWTDTTRSETLSDETNQPRELTGWIWYPAAPASDAAPAPYLPAAWSRARLQGMSVLSFLTQNLAKVQSHALADPPLADSLSPFPVIVMQPGLGPLITDYTTLAEGLASRGYVVVGSNPTYSASVVVFGDGRVARGTPAGNVPDNASPAEAKALLDRLITVWAADDQFVMDQLERLNAADPTGMFTGRLDMQEIGVFGHSFGGATAAQVCQLDARCKAGVDLDGYPYGTVVREGLHQPFMFMWSEPPSASDPAWQQAMRDSEAIATRWPHDDYQVTVNGMRHFNFSDYAVLFTPVVKLTGGLGPIDGRRGLAITEAYVQAFFDRYLKQQAAPLLNGPSAQFPEVDFKAR